MHNFLMFLLSGEGAFLFTFVLVSGIILLNKTRLIKKKFAIKRVWKIIMLVVSLILYIIVIIIEPGIADEKILNIEYLYRDEKVLISNEKQRDKVSFIKWEIFKLQLFWKLGIRKMDKMNNASEVMLYTKNKKVIKVRIPAEVFESILDEDMQLQKSS